MPNQSAPELFTQRPVSSDFGRQQGPIINLRILFVLAVLAGGGALIGMAVSHWQHKEETIANGDVPTVKSEGDIMKKPDEPGGLDVPHQDVTVFQQLEKKSQGEKAAAANGSVEHLLPPPETPQPVPTSPTSASVAPSPMASPVQNVQASPEPMKTPTIIEKPSTPIALGSVPPGAQKTEKLIENAKPVASSAKAGAAAAVQAAQDASEEDDGNPMMQSNAVASAVKADVAKTSDNAVKSVAAVKAVADNPMKAAAAAAEKPVKVEEINPGLPIKKTESAVKEKASAMTSVTKESVKAAIEGKKTEAKDTLAVKSAKIKSEIAKSDDAGHLPEELFTTGEMPSTPAKAKKMASAATSSLSSASEEAVSSVSGKKVRVQLGSLPDEGAAQSLMRSIQSKYGSQLSGLSLEIVRADLGAKGTYYRVMSKSVPEGTAKTMCSNLQKQGAACFISR